MHDLHAKAGITRPLSGVANLVAIVPLVVLVVWLGRRKKEGLSFFATLFGSMLLIATCADRTWYHQSGEQPRNMAVLSAGYVGLRATGHLNIRSGPGAGYKVVGIIGSGDYLALSPPDAQGWSRIYDVSGKGRVGYVYRRSSLLSP